MELAAKLKSPQTIVKSCASAISKIPGARIDYIEAVDASTLAPLNYFQLALAVMWGELFFGQMPSFQSFAGIALIVAAGLTLTLPMLISSLKARSLRRAR
jgi:uncharacterized membrane protein